MTAPSTEDKPSPPRRLRAGQVVTYRHPDPLGGTLEGVALVLRVPEEGAVTIAPLSPLHLQVAAEGLALVKPDEMHTDTPQPSDTGS